MVGKAFHRLLCKWSNSYPIETGTHSLYGGSSKPIEHYIKPYGTAYCAWPKQSSSFGKWEAKGVIITTSEKEREVVVMHREGLTRADCQHEMDKCRFVNKVLENVPECAGIEVVPVYYAKYTQKDSRGSKGSKDGFVLIRDAVKGQEEELLSPNISKLTNATSILSGYKLRVTSVRGVPESSHNGHVTYKLTSLVVRFESQDVPQTAKGFQSVDTFSDWESLQDLSGVWDCNTGLGTDATDGTSPRVQPSAPQHPPDYDDVISHCTCYTQSKPNATQSHQHSGQQTTQVEHPSGCQVTHTDRAISHQADGSIADHSVSVSNLPSQITHPHTASPCKCRLQPTAPVMPEEGSDDCETSAQDDATDSERFQTCVTCEHVTTEKLLTLLHGGPPPPYTET